MRKVSLFKRMVAESTEVISNPEKTHFILHTLIISSIVVFGIETLLMMFLEVKLALPEETVVVLDGLLLIIFLFPLNYIFIVRPMSLKIEEHHRTNLELGKSHEILERFFSINDILIAYMDSEFNFIRVNQAYADPTFRTFP